MPGQMGLCAHLSPKGVVRGTGCHSCVQHLPRPRVTCSDAASARQTLLTVYSCHQQAPRVWLGCVHTSQRSQSRAGTEHMPGQGSL